MLGVVHNVARKCLFLDYP